MHLAFVDIYKMVLNLFFLLDFWEKTTLYNQIYFRDTIIHGFRSELFLTGPIIMKHILLNNQSEFNSFSINTTLQHY